MIYRDDIEGLYFTLGKYWALLQAKNGIWTIVGNRGIVFYNFNIKQPYYKPVPLKKNDIEKIDKFLSKYKDKHKLIDYTFKEK